ncbi:MAG: hypothetical protein HXX11_21800 [Desulfuromonadales bacterium]|nr:hypothetical protein [Desulfuromonadales bacterium]
MLDSRLIDHLITIYLKAGIKNLESTAYKRPFIVGEIETMLDSDKLLNWNPSLDLLEGFSDFSSFRVEQLRERIKAKDDDAVEFYTDQLIKVAKNKYDIKLDSKSKIELGLRVLHCEKQLNEINGAINRGELSGLELLKEKVDRSKAYFDLKTVIDKYSEWFNVNKTTIKPGTRDDMVVECATLLEIFGNISIDTFNTVDSITFLKKTLLKFPKNRVQRYGSSKARHISEIIKSESNYKNIAPKTANEYIKRAKNLVDHAIKNEMHEKSNKWIDELFKGDDSEGAKRQAYDDDISRLINALCTQDLWKYNPPKPERFWIILIALFHGLRLSNITGLNKCDIILTNLDIWVFRVRFGKTQNTIKDYPIHDCLILLGFLEWIEKLDRSYLFQDSSDQISKWWNRINRDREGNVLYGGFEYSHITTDPSKCLYSLRHHYAGEVYDATQDYKGTAEALGHSMTGKVTNGYIGKIRLKAHKELIDKLQFTVDLNGLEARAKELFNFNA